MRVPTYERQVMPQVVGNHTYANAPAAAYGVEVQPVDQSGFARGLMGGLNTYAAELQKAQDEKDNLQVYKALNDLRSRGTDYFYNGNTGLFTTALGEKAAGTSDRTKQWCTDTRADIVKSYNLNSQQQVAFARAADGLQTSWSEAAMKHEVGQLQNLQNEQFKTTISTSQDAIIASPKDDNIYNNSRDIAQAALIAQGEKNGWSDDILKDKLKKLDSQLSVARVNGMLSGNDPYGANKFMQQHKGDFTGEDFAKVGSVVRSRVEAAEAKARMEQERRRLQAERAAAKAAVQARNQRIVDMSNSYTKTYGMDYEKLEAETLKQGSDFYTKTPEEQEVILKSMQRYKTIVNLQRTAQKHEDATNQAEALKKATELAASGDYVGAQQTLQNEPSFNPKTIASTMSVLQRDTSTERTVSDSASFQQLMRDTNNGQDFGKIFSVCPTYDDFVARYPNLSKTWSSKGLSFYTNMEKAKTASVFGSTAKPDSQFKKDWGDMLGGMDTAHQEAFLGTVEDSITELQRSKSGKATTAEINDLVKKIYVTQGLDVASTQWGGKTVQDLGYAAADVGAKVIYMPNGWYVLKATKAQLKTLQEKYGYKLGAPVKNDDTPQQLVSGS